MLQLLVLGKLNIIFLIFFLEKCCTIQKRKIIALLELKTEFSFPIKTTFSNNLFISFFHTGKSLAAYLDLCELFFFAWAVTKGLAMEHFLCGFRCCHERHTLATRHQRCDAKIPYRTRWLQLVNYFPFTIWASRLVSAMRPRFSMNAKRGPRERVCVRAAVKQRVCPSVRLCECITMRRRYPYECCWSRDYACITCLSVYVENTNRRGEEFRDLLLARNVHQVDWVWATVMSEEEGARERNEMITNRIYYI